MVGFENSRQDLDALGAKVIALSTDPVDKAREVAADLSFPVAYGITRDMADSIGAWWEERRAFIQPSEFVLDAAGKVVHSSYSSGPIGRIDAADVVKALRRRESQQQ